MLNLEFGISFHGLDGTRILQEAFKAISFNISSYTHMHPQVELSNVVGYNPLYVPYLSTETDSFGFSTQTSLPQPSHRLTALAVMVPDELHDNIAAVFSQIPQCRHSDFLEVASNDTPDLLVRRGEDMVTSV